VRYTALKLGNAAIPTRANGKLRRRKMIIKRTGSLFFYVVFAMVLLFTPATAPAIDFQVPGTNTNLTVGGYVKLDVIYNDVSAGDNNQANIEYVPSGVPLDDATDGEEDHLVFNGRESRIWVKTSTPTDFGPIKSHLEFDFDTNTGNQVVSNSHQSRIRHAYFTLNNWLMGRTWSLFMHLDSLPELNDFGGPTGSMFVRQAQVRYTIPLTDSSSLAIGLENPETYANTGAFDDGLLPDMIIRYNMNPDWGNLSAAAMIRNLVVDNGTVDDTAFTFSGQVGAVVKITPNDTIQGAIQAGDGLGRYSSLASHFDGVVSNDGDVEALQQIAGFIGYRHVFGGAYNWRTNVVMGYSKADDPSEINSTANTEQTFSIHANAFMDWVPGARLGVEYIRGEREVYDGRDGTLNRIQFSARYLF
jgi:hypothetical protein